MGHFHQMVLLAIVSEYMYILSCVYKRLLHRLAKCRAEESNISLMIKSW